MRRFSTSCQQENLFPGVGESLLDLVYVRFSWDTYLNQNPNKKFEKLNKYKGITFAMIGAEDGC